MSSSSSVSSSSYSRTQTTTVIPELQSWFYDFVKGSSVNKNKMPLPVDINDRYLSPDSFIALLFNDNYDTITYPTYKYLYKDEDFSFWPNKVKRRIMIYPVSARYLVTDNDTGLNVFMLRADDLTLLDALLAYRGDSTSLIITSSISTSFDSTSNILYANYDNLSTYLSKLIFLYIDLKINNNYSNYNTTSLVSTGAVLDSLYETYVMDQFFDFMTVRVPDVTTFD